MTHCAVPLIAQQTQRFPVQQQSLQFLNSFLCRLRVIQISFVCLLPSVFVSERISEFSRPDVGDTECSAKRFQSSFFEFPHTNCVLSNIDQHIDFVFPEKTPQVVKTLPLVAKIQQLHGLWGRRGNCSGSYRQPTHLGRKERGEGRRAVEAKLAAAFPPQYSPAQTRTFFPPISLTLHLTSPTRLKSTITAASLM